MSKILAFFFFISFYFIPFYNEEKKNIKNFLRSLNFFIKTDNQNNYIIVDDGSVDKTKKILEAFISKLEKRHKKRIKFFNNKTNR